MVIVCSIAFTFLHEYQPKYSTEYIEVKKQYKRIIKNRDTNFESILVKLKNGNISVDKYTELHENVRCKAENKLAIYHESKDLVKAKDSVLGYTSYKNYLLGISMPYFGLITTLILLYVIVKDVQDKNKKIFFLVITFTLVAAWGYWVSWSNLNHTQDPKRPGDFPRSFYNIALYILPAVFFFASYFIIKSLKTIEDKVSIIIGIFYKAFYRDLQKENLVNPEKVDEFRIFRTRLTQKAVDNE